MNDQKIDNLLNLALNATSAERARSENLGIGFDAEDDTWEVIIKYTGNLERIRQIAKNVTELFGGFAILQIKEDALGILAEFPEVTYVEKPKALIYSVEEAREAFSRLVNSRAKSPKRLFATISLQLKSTNFFSKFACKSLICGRNKNFDFRLLL